MRAVQTAKFSTVSYNLTSALMASHGFYDQFHAQTRQTGNGHERHYQTPKTMVGLDPRVLAEQGIVAISPSFLKHLQQCHQPAKSVRHHYRDNLGEAHVVQRPRGSKRVGPDIEKALAHVHDHEPGDDVVYSSRSTAAKTNRHHVHDDIHTTHQRLPALVGIEFKPAAHEPMSNGHRATAKKNPTMALHEPPAMRGLGAFPAYSRNKLAHNLGARLKTLWSNASTAEDPASQTSVSIPSVYTPTECNSIWSSPNTSTTDWGLEALAQDNQSPEQSIYELELEDRVNEENGYNLWFQWVSGPLAGIEAVSNSPNIMIGQLSPTPSSLRLSQMTTHYRNESAFNPWEDLTCSAEVKINSWTLALGGGMEH